MKKIRKVFSLILTLAMLMQIIPLNISLANDMVGHWAEMPVNHAVDKGYIKGYPDGSMFPDNQMTRAEFAAIVCRVLDLPLISTHPFEDLDEGAWYVEYIATLYNAGIVSGTSETTFEPDRTITRSEAVVMLARAFKITDWKDNIRLFNDDIEIEDWARSAVYAMLSNGYIKGDNEGKFNPQHNITRAESCQIIYNKEYTADNFAPSDDAQEPAQSLTPAPTTKPSSGGGGGGGGGKPSVPIVYDGSTKEKAIRLNNGNIMEYNKKLTDEETKVDALKLHYILTEDITLPTPAYGESNWIPVGEVIYVEAAPDYDYSKAFYGSFNGNGYVISGLTINNADNRCAGLFGAIGEGAEVWNLGLIDISINGRNQKHIAGIIAISRGALKNCYVKGTISGYEAYDIGGAVGINNGGIVQNCYSAANVTAYFDNSISIFGGIACSNINGGIIRNCFATGEIYSRNPEGYAGGIVGYQESESLVENCVALNTQIRGLAGDGRIIGYNIDGELKNNYAYKNTETYWSNQADSGEFTLTGKNGKDLTVKELITKSTWDNAHFFDAGSPWKWTQDRMPHLTDKDMQKFPEHIDGYISGHTISIDSFKGYENNAIYFIKNENDRRNTEANLSENAVIRYNGKATPIDDVFGEGKVIYEYCCRSGTITLADTDRDMAYDAIDIRVSSVFVVDEVDVSRKTLTSRNNVGSLDLMDAKFTLTKNGISIPFGSLQKFDVLEVFGNDIVNDGEKAYEIKIITDKVDGKVTEVASSIYSWNPRNDGSDGISCVIYGKEYNVAVNAYRAASIKTGSMGTFCIDSFGKIAAFMSVSTGSNYGYITNVDDASGSFSNRKIVQILGQYGSLINYRLAKTVNNDTYGAEIDSFLGDGTSFASSDAFDEFMLGSIETGMRYVDTNGILQKNLTGRRGKLVRFETNSNGEIYSIEFAKVNSDSLEYDVFSQVGSNGDPDYYVSGYNYDGDTQKLSSLGRISDYDGNGTVGSVTGNGRTAYLDENTLVFFVYVTNNYYSSRVDTNKSEVKTISSLVDGMTYPTMQIFDIDEYTNTAKAVVVYADMPRINYSNSMAVVNSVSEANNDEGDKVSKVSFYQNGEKKEAITTTGMISRAKELKKGFGVQFTFNAKGEIDGIQVLYEVTNAGVKDDIPAITSDLSPEFDFGDKNVVYQYVADTPSYKKLRVTAGPARQFKNNRLTVAPWLCSDDTTQMGIDAWGYRSGDFVIKGSVNFYIYDNSRNEVAKLLVGDSGDINNEYSDWLKVGTGATYGTNGYIPAPAFAARDYVIVREYDDIVTDVVVVKAYPYNFSPDTVVPPPDTTLSAKTYGYLMGALPPNEHNDNVQLYILTQNGTKQELNVTKTVTIDGEVISTSSIVLDRLRSAAENQNNDGGEGTEYTQVIKYSTTVSGGITAVDSITTINNQSSLLTHSRDTKDKTFTYSSSNQSLTANNGSYTTIGLNGAYIFVVPENRKSYDNYRRGTVSGDFRSKKDTYVVETYDLSTSGIAKVVVLYATSFSTKIDSSTPVMMFDSISQSTLGGETLYRVKAVTVSPTGVNLASASNIWIEKGVATTKAQTLKKGDLFRAGDSSNQQINKIEIISGKGEASIFDEVSNYDSDDIDVSKKNAYDAEYKIIRGSVYSLDVDDNNEVSALTMIADIIGSGNATPDGSAERLTIQRRDFSNALFYEYDIRGSNVTITGPADGVRTPTESAIIDGATAYEDVIGSSDRPTELFIYMSGGAVKLVVKVIRE